MSSWRVVYDFRKPNWVAYGHVLFVEAESQADADVTARNTAQQAEPDGTLIRVEVRPATPEQVARHQRLRAAQALWKANAAAGRPNDPASV